MGTVKRVIATAAPAIHAIRGGNSATPRVAQIGAASEQIDCELAKLSERVSELADRLSVVLRPSAPQGDTGNEVAPMTSTAPLAESMNRQAFRINVTNSNLADLLDRLEL